MSLNPDEWRLIFDAIVAVVVVINTIYTWISNRQKANRTALAELGGLITQLTNRVDVMEHDIKHLPNDDDLADLHKKVNVVAKEVSNISGMLTALQPAFLLIQEHLLNGGK